MGGMIIDAHTHVYAWPKITSPKRDDGMTFYSMERQIEFMDSLGIDKAVILPLTNAEAPAEPQSLGEVLYIRDQYPGRFIPYCNIDPRLPKEPSQITKDDFVDLLVQYREAGCYGLGELTARIPWYHPSLQSMLAACEEVGFPVIFHSITSDVDSYGVIDDIGLPGLEYTLRRFPNLNIVGHSPGFWSEITGDVTHDEKNSYAMRPVAPGGAVVRLMRQYPNLYGDLSAGSGFKALARDPEFAFEFIAEFSDRLFFGLDCNYPTQYSGLLDWLKEHRDSGDIAAEHYEAIVSGNLARVLGLEV